MPEEFVILRHSGYGPEHYDLMLQTGDVLATWQLAADPCGLASGQSLPAKRLTDHRMGYLAYEGPVSKDRGRVDRVEIGTVERTVEQPDRWVVDLAGAAMQGTFELQCEDPQRNAWRLTRVS